jgi:uncharacterized protein (UPF0248 family)
MGIVLLLIRSIGRYNLCFMITEMVARLHREVFDTRIQHLKRAIVLSMKHQYLPCHRI